MELKELLVVIPHSSIMIPGEIPLESLSERFPALVQNVDWYTNWLYDFREDELLKELGAGKDGTRVDKMISVAEARGFHVEARQGWTLRELKRYIDEGNPVIILLQAWADRYMTLKGWRNDDGHYAVVIGHARGVLLFEDPASFRRTWLREYEFLAHWHDLDSTRNQKYEQFGMVLLGREPIKQAPEHMD
jgi:ABC-type bacteriocin/lantibiotic exporter with double-glycine peptidase domain